MPSRLHATYGRFKSKLLRLKTECETRKRQLEKLNDEIRETEIAISALRQAGAADGPTKATVVDVGDDAREGISAPNQGSQGRFGDYTRHIDQIVNSLKSGEQLRRSEISGRLKEQGFGPAGIHAKSTLFSTLQRLKKQGRIGARKVDGEWYFFGLGHE